jgi:hypothetical protein
MPILNLICHVTLPSGLTLVNGAYLATPVTFDVVSSLMPYYASVDQVRLQGGAYIRKLSDLTLASMIYNVSKEVDLLYPPGVQISITNSPNMFRFVGSRNQYVQALCAKNLLESLLGVVGVPASHILANLSITRQRANEKEGVGQKITSLEETLALYKPTIASGGNVVPGGYAKSQFAAKGVFDWTERTPARTWMSTGMGANASSQDFGSPTGGRGKPVKFFSSPFYSPPIINLRSGIFQGAYPLVTVYPYPQNSP